MHKKQHFMVRLVRTVALLFVLLAGLMVFVYTPFYSKCIVFLLNHFVPIEVNLVAAKSQQIAALSEHDNLEPGSDLWIARQAYLNVLQDTAQREDAQSLNLIEARYKVLEQQISKNHVNDDQDSDEPQQASDVISTHQAALHVAPHPQDEAAAASNIAAILRLNSDVDAQLLMEKYTKFLNQYPVKIDSKEPVSSQVSKDLQQVKNNNHDYKVDTSKPSAIVVLGGGLTFDKTTKSIVVNGYTRLRLEKTLEVEQQNQLPIVLSGVEAPYMQKWLQQRGVDAKLLEKRSMNTCENSRFSSLLLQKKGGAPKIILITDEYHMPRTRRLFAMNGIATVPVNAPIPSQLTTWKPALQNYDHSRRANYELLATIRDVVFGTSDCREVP